MLLNLKSCLPPPARRALVMIDPAFERADEAQAVCRALESVPGALHAQADHTRGVATLEAEAPLDEEALRRAVAAEDYEVKEIMRETV